MIELIALSSAQWSGVALVASLFAVLLIAMFLPRFVDQEPSGFIIDGLDDWGFEVEWEWPIAASYPVEEDLTIPTWFESPPSIPDA